MNVVVVAGIRVAELEVCPGRRTGSVRQADRTHWTIEQPPGASEWWVADGSGKPVATLERPGLFGERFAIDLDEAAYRVLPRGGGWRRRWSIVDDRGRELLEVLQRPLARSVHDLRRRSGDVPQELPLLAAWALALATSAPMPDTRRPRWTVH